VGESGGGVLARGLPAAPHQVWGLGSSRWCVGKAPAASSFDGLLGLVLFGPASSKYLIETPVSIGHF